MKGALCYPQPCLVPGTANVLTNGRPTAVTGSFWGVSVIWGSDGPICGPFTHIGIGIGNVFCNGRPAMHIGDPTVASCAITGSPNVMM
jgi:uncharacterized Zn-binding protein involved in type VI secretion